MTNILLPYESTQNSFTKNILALCFSCFLSLHVLAQAPVVDDSENFAIFDEQQTTQKSPIINTQHNYSDDYNDTEVALAQDNNRDDLDNIALLNKLKGMQQDIQELRGQLEVQAHDLKLLQQQQLSFYKDIDRRLPRALNNTAGQDIKLETDLTPTNALVKPSIKSNVQSDDAIGAPHISISSRNNPADEQISYLAAYDLIKTKQFDNALLAMQTFVSKYPQGGYTANAQYWLGELYIVKKDYPKAIEHFEIVLKHFPSSSKAAASSLKIGYALASSGKKIEARQHLRQVLINYPNTPTAQLAEIKLKTINTL